MIPYFMKDGKKVRWPADVANILYQRFRTEIITELRKRDVSRGVPLDGRVYTEVKGDKEDKDKTTGVQVNPHLSGLKHAGTETNNRLKKKWYDFCIVPQALPTGEDTIEVPIPEPVYKPSVEPDDPANKAVADVPTPAPVDVQALRKEGKKTPVKKE